MIGRPLVLQSLPFEDQRKFATNVAAYQAQLLRIRFDSIGCLINSPAGQSVVGALDDSRTSPFFLEKDRGPFGSSRTFVQAHDDIQFDLITTDAARWKRQWRDPWIPATPSRRHAHSGGFSYFQRLQRLPIERTPESPSVPHHPDLDIGDLLVSYSNPTEMVGVLDWEGSRIAPLWDAFLYLRRVFLPVPGARDR